MKKNPQTKGQGFALILVCVVILLLSALLVIIFSSGTKATAAATTLFMESAQDNLSLNSALELGATQMLTPFLAERTSCEGLTQATINGEVFQFNNTYHSTFGVIGGAYAGDAQLQAPVDSASTTIATTHFAFPSAPSGVVQLGDELIYYRDTSPACGQIEGPSGAKKVCVLSGLTRGFAKTVPGVHPKFFGLSQQQCDLQVTHGTTHAQAVIGLLDTGFMAGQYAGSSSTPSPPAGNYRTGIVQFDQNTTWQNQTTTIDNALLWNHNPGPGPTINVLGIQAFSSGSAFAIDDGKRIWQLRGILGWFTVATKPATGTPVDATYNAIFCPSETECWIGGSTKQATGSQPVVLQRLQYQNSQWRLSYDTSWFQDASFSKDTNPNKHIYGITCTSTQNCWAVGASKPAAISLPSTPWILNWNGSKWSSVTISTPQSSVILKSVGCVGSNRCVAVGQASGTAFWPIAVLNNKTWSMKTSQFVLLNTFGGTGTLPASNLNAIACGDALHPICYAVGDRRSASAIANILLYNATADSWSQVNTRTAPALSLLTGISCANPEKSCWVAGYGVSNFVPLHFDGTAWTAVATPKAFLKTPTINAVLIPTVPFVSVPAEKIQMPLAWSVQ